MSTMRILSVAAFVVAVLLALFSAEMGLVSVVLVGAVAVSRPHTMGMVAQTLGVKPEEKKPVLVPHTVERSQDNSGAYVRVLLGRLPRWELRTYKTKDITSEEMVAELEDIAGTASLVWHKPKVGLCILFAYDFGGNLLGAGEVSRIIGVNLTVNAPEKAMKYIATLLRPEEFWTQAPFSYRYVSWLTDGEIVVSHEFVERLTFSSFGKDGEPRARKTMARILGGRKTIQGRAIIEGTLWKFKGLVARKGKLDVDVLLPAGGAKEALDVSGWYFGATTFERGKRADLSIQPIVFLPFLHNYLPLWMKEARAKEIRDIQLGVLDETLTHADAAWAPAIAAKWNIPLRMFAGLIRKVFADAPEKLRIPAPTVTYVATSDASAVLAHWTATYVQEGEIRILRDSVILNAADFLRGRGASNHGGGDFDGDTLQLMPIYVDGQPCVIAWRLPMGPGEFSVYRVRSGWTAFLKKVRGFTIPSITAAELPKTKAELQAEGLAQEYTFEKPEKAVHELGGKSIQNVALDLLRQEMAMEGLLGSAVNAVTVAVMAEYDRFQLHGWTSTPLLNLSDVVDATVNGGTMAKAIKNAVRQIRLTFEQAETLPGLAMGMAGSQFVPDHLDLFDGEHALDRVTEELSLHEHLREQNSLELQRRASALIPSDMKRIAERFMAEASAVWKVYIPYVDMASKVESEAEKNAFYEMGRESALNTLQVLARAMSKSSQEWQVEFIENSIAIALLVRQHGIGRHVETGVPQDSLCWSQGKILKEWTVKGTRRVERASGFVELTLRALAYFDVFGNPTEGLVGTVDALSKEAVLIRYKEVRDAMGVVARNFDRNVKEAPPEMLGAIKQVARNLSTIEVRQCGRHRMAFFRVGHKEYQLGWMEAEVGVYNVLDWHVEDGKLYLGLEA